MTAGGTLFVNLEDETGMVNVIVTKSVYQAQRESIRGARALLVTGTLEREDGAVNVVGGRFTPMKIAGALRSRDFR
jgi:error-prone DNA polymerase